MFLNFAPRLPMMDSRGYCKLINSEPYSSGFNMFAQKIYEAQDVIEIKADQE